jgi:uncharacterized membrane protein
MNWLGLGLLFLFTLAGWWAPYLMRRDLMFGATVPPDFRDSADAHGIIRRYRRKVLLAGIALINIYAFLWSMKAPMNSLWPIAPLLFSVASAIAFAQANRAARMYSVPASGLREASLLPTPRRSVEYSLMVLAGPVILALGFALAFLIPNANGEISFFAGWGSVVSRWNAIDALVDKPFSFALGACLGSFLVLLAFRFGTRRSPAGSTNYRRVILRNIILFNAAFAALSAWVVNMGAFGHAVDKVEMRVAMAFIFVGLAAHIGYVLLLRRKENMSLVTAAGHPLGDRTPDESWLWGMFYHNANDPALFVEKRSGPGYTVNFGHVRAWLMLAVFLTLMLLPFLLR